MFNYRAVNDDREGQLGGLSSLSSSLMMIITRLSLPIYGVLIMLAVMPDVDYRAGSVTLK
jgi:hypothetical protein